MSPASTSHQRQEIGTPVDDFTPTTIGGAETSPRSIFGGKRGAVVVFWSGLCSHCLRYDGYLNTFTTRRPEIALIALPSRHGEAESHIRSTMEERSLKFRGAIDNFKLPEDPERLLYLEPAIDQFLAVEPLTRNETASFGCAIQSVYYNLPKAL